VLFAYTFSKAISDVKVDGGESAQDVYNRRLERPVAEFNLPQFMKLIWIYELPFGKGRHFNLGNNTAANIVLGGWNVTGVQQYRSGSALAITESGYRSDALFNGRYRPDMLSGVPVVLDTGSMNVANAATSTQYLNPAAFAIVPMSSNGVPTRLGTAPRYLNNVRGPHYAGEDFGIEKKFPFGEDRWFQFRMDAFDAFNRAGRGGLITDVTSPLFGKLTGVQQGPRNIQLSLRLNF
jgi:hypothetical protein